MTVEEGSNTYDNAEQLTLFENSNSVDNKYNQLVKERMKISDERVQNNALLRRISREETLKEIAADYASTMQNFIPLKFQPVCRVLNEDKEAILQLSDWHYGIVVDSYWNKYDTDIARQRIQKLRDEVVSLIKKENIFVLHSAQYIKDRAF